MTGAAGPEAAARAPYASHPADSRGRRYPEAESATRTVYQRDRDRIVHSTAFRRLKHKTQVFVYHEGDHYRTRLTHSIEVAQVARSLARSLRLDEDLCEALALAHDLGHPPFGHAGEDALREAMRPYGGFDHNAQALRVLTELEARYASFDGLNLTWETLEGVAKHNGPPIGAGKGAGDLPWAVAACDRVHDLDLARRPAAEAQAAALSDDIAYHAHDVDDGLRAGLFAPEDLADVPLAGPIVAEVRRTYGRIAAARLVHETVRRLIDRMVSDAIAESRRRLAADAPASADAVRGLGRPVVAFSPGMAADSADLKSFLRRRMYHHARVDRMTSEARGVIGDLFAALLADPGRLPDDWRRKAAAAPAGAGRARVVADYVAGMTDRFAEREHRRLAAGTEARAGGAGG